MVCSWSDRLGSRKALVAFSLSSLSRIFDAVQMWGVSAWNLQYLLSYSR